MYLYNIVTYLLLIITYILIRVYTEDDDGGIVEGRKRGAGNGCQAKWLARGPVLIDSFNHSVK